MSQFEGYEPGEDDIEEDWSSAVVEARAVVRFLIEALKRARDELECAENNFDLSNVMAAPLTGSDLPDENRS